MKEPTRRQIFAMSFAALLSPATRLIPGAAARAAGHAAWLCPIAAAPFVALVAALVSKALSGKTEGEGLGETILRRSPRFGRLVLFVYGLWLALYAGFSVRSAASRFIYTVYTGASPWPFVAVGLGMGLLAALGSERRLARSCEFFRVLLLVAIVPILALGMAQADWSELLPVSYLDVPGVLTGGIETLGTICFVLVNVPFLETGSPIEKRTRGAVFWSLRICLFLAVLVASVLGRFGPELSGTLTYPFFALVRNTGLFGVAARIEAPVTALWVLSDFVLCAISLMAGTHAIASALSLKDRPERPKYLQPRALVTTACAILALVCALTIAPDSRVMRIVSDEYVVLANIAAIFALLLPALAVTARRAARESLKKPG